MTNLNRVILIGRLTKDPELRFTPNGTSVANFRIAVNRRWTNREGERMDSTDFFNVVVWGRLAELCSEHISKGSPVAVEGRLQTRSWETEEGQRRSTVEIVAENVQFLGRLGPREKEDVEAIEPPEEESTTQEEVGDDIPF
ncbi:MAG: single-stranded DNA-binding protein [Actinomycetota bacterium]